MSSVDNTIKAVETTERYLTFVLNEENYGINIHCVREIIAMMKVTTVPNLPHFIKGVINLRGQIIPVIDMRLKFHLPEKEYDDKTIIIIAMVSSPSNPDENIQIGFIVDATNEVLAVSSENIAPPPKFGTNINTDFIEGIYQDDNRVVMIINLVKIFTTEEIEGMTTMQDKNE